MGEVNQQGVDLPPVHGHCSNCFAFNCKVLPITDHSCPMVVCPANCKAKFHRCKIEDHRNLCPNEVVLCLNHWNGCKKRMPRVKAKKHLKVCPSSHRGYSQDFKFVNFYVALKQYQDDKTSKDHPTSESIHSKVSAANEAASNQSEMSHANECDLSGTSYNISDESYIVRKSLWIVPWQVQESPENEDFIHIHVSECKCADPSVQEIDPNSLPFGETSSDTPGFSMDALPYMIVRKIVGYLDTETLRNLSLVSYRTRLACASWLRELGSVTVVWEKKNGKWVDSKRIWKF